jgi:hypothetical protein
MNTIQQHALDAIVKNQIAQAHVVTNVRDVTIEYTAPDGSRCKTVVGDADCVILEFKQRSAQPPGVYIATEK